VAESDIFLRKIYELMLKQSLDKSSSVIPNESQIREYAQELAQYQNSVSVLEWQLAERKIIIQLILSKKP
jgi:hypothetical protein